MHLQSPSSVAHLIQTPILLLLGENDARVPPSSKLPSTVSTLVSFSCRWTPLVAVLEIKKRRYPVSVPLVYKKLLIFRTLVFPNVGHALDTVSSEKNGFDAVFSFLDRKLNRLSVSH